MESRALNRVTAFTDAAVAIALTVLALPLANLAREEPETPVIDILLDHLEEFVAFGVSFFVVMVFWRIHRRLFDQLRQLDERLLTLNIFWLLGMVFVPVPTAVLTFEGEVEHGATTLYMINLLFISLMLLAMAWHTWRHRELRMSQTEAAMRRQLRRAFTSCVMLAVVTVLAVPLGSGALLLLAAMPIVRRLTERLAQRNARWRSRP